jgi:hypothetical protein
MLDRKINCLGCQGSNHDYDKKGISLRERKEGGLWFRLITIYGEGGGLRMPKNGEEFYTTTSISGEILPWLGLMWSLGHSTVHQTIADPRRKV